MTKANNYKSMISVNTEDFYIENPASIPNSVVEEILTFTLNTDCWPAASVLDPVTGCVDLIEDFYETDLIFDEQFQDYDEVNRYNEDDYILVPTQLELEGSFAAAVTDFLKSCGHIDKYDYIFNGKSGVADRLRDCDLYYDFDEYNRKLIASRYFSWKKGIMEDYASQNIKA